MSSRTPSASTWRFVMRFNAGVIVFLAGVLIAMSLRLKSTVAGLDHTAYTKMIASLRQRPPTQKGYDFAISLAEGSIESEADLGNLVTVFMDLFLGCGVGLIVLCSVYVYAARRERMALSQPRSAR